MGCRQRVHGLATGADRQEKGAEDGWERGNLTTEGALPYRRISNAAKRFSPTTFIVPHLLIDLRHYASVYWSSTLEAFPSRNHGDHLGWAD